MNNPITYTINAFKFGERIYSSIKTRDLIDIQDENYNLVKSNNINEIIKRWNEQPQSPITGLKWVYTLVPKI